MVLRQIVEQKKVRNWIQTEVLMDLHGMGHQVGIKDLGQAVAATPCSAHLAPKSTLEAFSHCNCKVQINMGQSGTFPLKDRCPLLVKTPKSIESSLCFH